MITIIIKVIKVPDQSDHDDKNDLQSLSSGTFVLLSRLNLDESGDKRKQETAPLMFYVFYCLIFLFYLPGESSNLPLRSCQLDVSQTLLARLGWSEKGSPFILSFQQSHHITFSLSQSTYR